MMFVKILPFFQTWIRLMRRTSQLNGECFWIALSQRCTTCGLR